jgi:4-amino-4-deoxy-L-arabinose transferase-like glycosyltransferase
VVSNAIEMSWSGFSLVTTYGFKPDLWNTKPPLLIWLIAGCMRLFGPSEWAARLPSLVAAVATVAMVLAFSWRLTRNRFVAFAAPVLLTLSGGFYGVHAGQSADYEMLLCFFTTGYLLLLFEALHRPRAKARLVLASALMISGACLTKGVAGVLPGVGVAIYVVLRGRWPRLFKTPWYALGALIVVGVVGGYYVLREQAAPGYWAAVTAEELGGRYLRGMKSHVQSPVYYLSWVYFLFAIGPALILLPLAPLLRWPRTRASAFIPYGGLICAAMLAILTSSQTKIFWYMAPVYPILSIMMAIIFDRLLRLPGSDRPQLNRSRRLVLACIALVLAVLAVFQKSTWLPRIEDTPQGRYGLVFAELERAGIRDVRAIDGGVVNDDGFLDYTPQLHFYTMAWSQRGMRVRLGGHDDRQSLGRDEVIVTCDPLYLDAVRAIGKPLTTVEGCAAATRLPPAGQLAVVRPNTQTRQMTNRAVE